MIVSFIRYMQIRSIVESSVFIDIICPDRDEERILETIKRYKSINFWSFIIGMISAFSSCGTGAFRLGESFILHHLAAGGIFINTPIYMIIQTWFSYKFVGSVNSQNIYKARYYITVFNLSTVTLFAITLIASRLKFSGDFHNVIERAFWTPSKGGFIAHIINTMSEWLFLLSIAPYVYLFAYDFSRLSFSALKVEYNFYSAKSNTNVENGTNSSIINSTQNFQIKNNSLVETKNNITITETEKKANLVQANENNSIAETEKNAHIVEVKQYKTSIDKQKKTSANISETQNIKAQK